jgi:hypothetical protein
MGTQNLLRAEKATGMVLGSSAVGQPAKDLSLWVKRSVFHIVYAFQQPREPIFFVKRP